MDRLSSALRQVRRRICYKNVPSWTDNRPYWEKLPPELVFCITDSLDEPDTVCLALCSHHLLAVISKSNPPALFPRTRSRLKAFVLTRIARDIPGMFCCHRCAKSQRIADVTHPASSQTDRHNPCPDVFKPGMDNVLGPLWMFFSVHCAGVTLYDFRHCRLSAAMKNHYHGPEHQEGVTADSLAYTEVSRNLLLNPAVTTLLSVEGRVCPLDEAGDGASTSSLVLQVQSLALFHDSLDMDTVISGVSHVPICPHGQIRHVIADTASARACGLYFNKSELIKHMCCWTCGVEFRLNTAVVVTKWAELGAGLDMEDPKWKRLTTEEHAHGRSTITTAPGTVLQLFRDASQDQGWESDRTERNGTLLVMEKYRRLLHERGGIFYSSVPGHRRR
ncbi:uncharacterized protein BDW70DRAFT_158385 [Aspergillus foveolatus]|uniref:uncharacterized protein n=1 Tax=Aspergillus foveolatus TaxID=210207 RepID=UPI003CCE2F23